MKKYIVFDEPTKSGDIFSYVYDTPEQANFEAKKHWNHLTKNEQKSRHVSALVVDESCLCDWAIDEETKEIDWTAFHSAYKFPGSFDSDDLQK